MLIEVNRRLYMDEMTGKKLLTFEAIKAGLKTLLMRVDRL